MKTKPSLAKSVLFFTVGTLPVALLLLANTGCGSTKVSTNTQASVGQQLMDLKKAHEQGLVGDKDYEKLREAIILKNQ
jgi:hypothetical protein